MQFLEVLNMILDGGEKETPVPGVRLVIVLNL